MHSHTIHLHMYGFICAATKLITCDGDGVALKAENRYSLALYRRLGQPLVEETCQKGKKTNLPMVSYGGMGARAGSYRAENLFWQESFLTAFCLGR